MKKTLMMMLMAAGLGTASAQISKGGFPLSKRLQIENTAPSIHYYPLPDWKQRQSVSASETKRGIIGPEIVGLFAATDVHFPESGTFTYLADGQTIWRAQIQIDGAPAIGLYYDDFFLPPGVTYYISNVTGSHQLGAYTNVNSPSRVFVHEPVQGATANLEINIPKGIAIGDIRLHINRALVYFSSISYLDRYKEDEPSKRILTTGLPDTLGLEGYSSTCQINAICPLGSGYEIQRKATVQLIIPYDSVSAEVGGCSATLINNTGNEPGNCKPYLLTATHCEKQDHTDAHALPFELMLVRFNFENEDCSGSTKATVNTLSGVALKARAAYPDPNVVLGDFMLLSLKESIPADWDAYLAGWNRADSLPLHLESPGRYTGFHHPAGDSKKVLAAHNLNPNGYAFDPPVVLGTHWELGIDSGGIEVGSSGSGLFDADGHVVGIASVAYDPKPGCNTSPNGEPAQFMTGVAYSKLSYAWDYGVDGTGNFRKLQPWLDPINSGAVTLNPVKSNCDAAPTSIKGITKNELDNAILIYPNPSSTGMFSTQINFKNQKDIQVEVIDISGNRVVHYLLRQAQSERFLLDLSHLPNGIYMARFTSQHESATRKIIINR